MPLRKAFEGNETILDLSADAVAKMAMAEELRLVASKMDRLWSAIEAKIPLQEEFVLRFREMKEATIELQRARRNLKRKYQCQKKKNTKCESPKKIYTGLISALKRLWKF